MYKIILVVLLQGIVSEAQRFSLGSCPTITPTPPSTNQLIGGTWFEYARTGFPSLPIGKCLSITFVETTQNQTQAFTLTINWIDLITNILRSLNGRFTLSSTGGVLQGSIELQTHNGSLIVVVSPIVVIVPNFIVFYLCQSLGFGRIESALILSANRIPAPGQVDIALAALGGISIGALPITSQTGC